MKAIILFAAIMWLLSAIKNHENNDVFIANIGAFVACIGWLASKMENY